MTVIAHDQRDQYTATSGQTVFNYVFKIAAATDLNVYQRAAGSDPNDATDLLTYITDYTVTGVGNNSGGTVVLVNGATAGDIITIEGGVPVSRSSSFTPGGMIRAEDLNNEFDNQTLIAQKQQTILDDLTPKYPESAIVQDHDVILPVLPSRHIWVKNSADNEIITGEYPENGAASKIDTYVTMTDETANEPNSYPLSAIGGGMMANDPGSTQIHTRTITGTANQLTVANGNGVSGNPTISIADNPIIPGTAGMGIPQGTTDQRVVPSVGIGLRFNTDLDYLEGYIGGQWVTIPSSGDIASLQALLASHANGQGASMVGLENQGTVSNKTVQDLAEATFVTVNDETGTLLNSQQLSALALLLSGGTMTGDIDMGGNKVTNAATPTVSSDYATKGYIDSIVYGVHPPAIYATTANLSGYTYNNGSSGVGATLTAGSNGAFTVDGASPSQGMRILVPNQTAQAENGIYTLTQVGDGSSPAILTRATDYDQSSDMQPGDMISIAAGATLAGHQFMMTQTAAITVGTTAITWLDVTNTGLGTMSLQDADNVAITGGTVTGLTEFEAENIKIDGDAIQHIGDLNNQIIFGTDTQDYQTGGASRLDISDSGIRLGGANSRVTTILDEDDMASDSATALATQQSIKAYVDNALPSGGINPNIIIGGNFTTNPWQRGVSATGLTGTGETFLADRFSWLRGGDGVVSYLKTADAPTISQAGVFCDSCLHIDVTTADASIGASEYYTISYRVEGYDLSEIGFGQSNALPITLSFWHKHTKTGTYTVAFVNSATDRSYIAEYNQSVSDTWEKAVITLTADTTGTWLYNNGVGVRIYFNVSIGSDFNGTANSWQAGNLLSTVNQVNGMDSVDNNFKLALVKLEKGSTATDYPTELEVDVLTRCQRYYEKSYNIDVYPGAVTFAGSIQVAMQGSPSQYVEYNVPFCVIKRSSPNITLFNAGTGEVGTCYQDTGTSVPIFAGRVGVKSYGAALTNSSTNYGSLHHFVADAEL